MTSDLTTAYTHDDVRIPNYDVRVEGIPFETYVSSTIRVRAVDYSYSFGATPTCDITIDNPVFSTLKTFSSGRRPRIYVGTGMNGVAPVPVFSGIIHGISTEASYSVLHCLHEGAARLSLSYREDISVNMVGDVNDLVTSVLDEGGVTNYLVNLPTWAVGAVKEQVLKFKSYGEAVIKLAEVDGSPWYVLPSGQLRVELRDPLPGIQPFRQYYSAQRDIDGNEAQPPGITDPDARPRIRKPQIEDFPEEVYNQITVQGAVITTIGPNGEQNQNTIKETVFNTSPWIETPPGFRDWPFQNELIDTAIKAATTAQRYYQLKNRLETRVNLEVAGDSEIFLGATVEVIDLDYAAITGRWFVFAYRTHIDASSFSTTLDLRGGGPSAGNVGLLPPNADFVWINTGKVTQVIPGVGIGTVITYDGGPSVDLDGTIASYAWSDDQGNSGTARYFLAAYPDSVSTVQVTLTVTDNDGLTGSITKTVQPQGNDAKSGGATPQNTFIVCAAESHVLITKDGAQTWTTKTRANILAAAGLVVPGATKFVSADILAIKPDKALVVIGTDGDLFVGADAAGIMISHDSGATFPNAVVLDHTFLGSGRFVESVNHVLCVKPTLNEPYPILPVNGLPFLTQPYGYTIWLLGVTFNNGRGGVIQYVTLVDSDGNDIGGIVEALDFGAEIDATAIQWSSIKRVAVSGGQGYARIFAFGGDTADARPTNMAVVGTPYYAPVRHGGALFNFQYLWSPIALGAALEAAMIAAGPGSHHLVSGIAEYNEPANSIQLAVLFDTGVEPRFWSGINEPAATAAVGLPAGVDGRALARGITKGSALVGLDSTTTWFTTTPPVDFTGGDSTTPSPSKINDIAWESGQSNVYIGAAEGGVVKSLDAGKTWGYILPFAPLGTTWPVGAVGRAIGFSGHPVVTGNGSPLYIANGQNHDFQRLKLDLSGWSLKDGVLTGAGSNPASLKYYGNGKLTITDAQNGSLWMSFDYGETFAQVGRPDAGWSIKDACLDVSGKLYSMWVAGGFEFRVRSFTPTPSNIASPPWVVEQDIHFNNPTIDSCWSGTVSCHPSRADYVAISYQRNGIPAVLLKQGFGGWARRNALGNNFDMGVWWANDDRLVFAQHNNLSGVRVYISDDFAVSWTQVLFQDNWSNGTVDIDFLRYGGAASKIFVMSAHELFPGDGTNVLFVSKDNCATWTKMTPPANDAINGITGDTLADTLFVRKGQQLWFTQALADINLAAPTWTALPNALDSAARGIVVIGDQSS